MDFQYSDRCNELRSRLLSFFDKNIYPNESVFDEIEAERRIVIRHVCQPHSMLTITLVPAPGGTLIHWEQVFADTSVTSAIRHIVTPSNEQNLDRLGAKVGQGKAPAA